jgi:hypothetical protein
MSWRSNSSDIDATTAEVVIDLGKESMERVEVKSGTALIDPHD